MTREQKLDKRHEVNERMGQRIEALRKMKGWTQAELEMYSGIGRSHINRIEAGKYAAKLDTIQAIAEAFGMTVDIVDPGLQNLAPLKKL